MPTKRRLAAKKAPRTGELKSAGKKAAKTRKRRAATRKAGATKKPQAAALEVPPAVAKAPDITTD